MQKIIVLSICLIFSNMVSGQVFDNVQVIAEGSRVRVLYSLNDSANTYKVDLLYSDDDGVSFSEPLRLVSGDVNVVKNAGKKEIIWEAQKEFGSFSKNIIFRISAKRLPKNYPVKIENNDLVVEIKRIETKQRKIIVHFMVTSNKQENYMVNIYGRNNFIIDAFGNEYKLEYAEIGGVGTNGFKRMFPDLPVDGELHFTYDKDKVHFIEVLSFEILPNSHTKSSDSNVFAIKSIPIYN